ncbi:MAG: DNA-directed RNA polymerase subunit H [Candidatus Nanohaloarchaeota archaeon QJJ-5]|nr:DNA-directed RNA polymerase subunit H [Candidatus Nanohaloarchaeota archaeon QJJ-5]
MDVEAHQMVPEHEKLDEDEVETLLEAYNIEKDDLPAMERTDAVAKQKGFEPGDVVKITRDSPTAGETVYYRHVVDE